MSALWPITHVYKNCVNLSGNSPLHVACSQHIPERPGSPCPCQVNVHVLLKHGAADPNIKVVDTTFKLCLKSN